MEEMSFPGLMPALNKSLLVARCRSVSPQLVETPPPKYFGGLDITDPESMQSAMHYILSKTDPGFENIFCRFLYPREQMEVDRMLVEAVDNKDAGRDLLYRMLNHWTMFFDDSNEDIMDASRGLQRWATWIVRNPNSNVEEYEKAEKSFKVLVKQMDTKIRWNVCTDMERGSYLPTHKTLVVRRTRTKTRRATPY